MKKNSKQNILKARELNYIKPRLQKDSEYITMNWLAES